MSKYKYVLTFENGEIFDSLEEYGDDEFQGTFKSYNDAEEAALYACSCSRCGAEILHMSNPGDYDFDDETWKSPGYEVIEIDE